jgi:hypothetical protein
MKLQRAEEHFGQLLAEDAAFRARNPYRVLRETDDRDHCFKWRVKIVEQPPIERWSAMIGECVHALRAALDHTAYALVNRDQRVSDKTEFPIFYDRAPTEADYAKKLPGVGPEVIAIVEELQPYNRGGLDDPLYTIHRLDVLDKHRYLHLASATLEGSYYEIIGAEVKLTDPGHGPFEDGAILGRFEIISSPGANVRMETHFAFGMAFGQGEPLAGRSVIPELEWLRVYTGGVLARFDEFFG